MVKLESVLEVPEGAAAILYDSGDYKLLRTHSERQGGRDCTAFDEVNSGEGIRNLTTRDLFGCAGVMYRNGDNYVLAHGTGMDNLRVLLGRVNQLSIEDAGKKPEEVDLCTPNEWINYEGVIKISLGEEVQVRTHRKKLHFVGQSQSATIGKDILDFGDKQTLIDRLFVMCGI